MAEQEIRMEFIVAAPPAAPAVHATESCSCNLCDYKADQNSPIDKHKQVVHKEFSCTLCDFKSGHPSALKRHKDNLHNKDNQTTYTCDMCNYTTIYKFAMKRHTANKHNKASLVSFKCSFCDYTSTYEFSIERHITTVHLKENEHACTICDYTTMHKHSLDRHKRIVHERELSHFCDHCDFVTGHKSTLRLHVATEHQSRKVLRCTECGYETLYRTALSRHLNTVNCKQGDKVVGAGNMLRQERHEHEARAAATLVKLEQQQRNLPPQENPPKRDVVQHTIDPLQLEPAELQQLKQEQQQRMHIVTSGSEGHKAVSVLSGAVVSAGAEKSIVINTSSVNFPRVVDAFSTSLMFNTNPATSSINLIEKDGLLYQLADRHKPTEIIQVSTEEFLRAGPSTSPS